MRALWLLALAACDATTLPPEGQIVFYVTTDAPLPPPAGSTTTSGSVCPSQPPDVPPLFDSVRIDLYEPNSQTPCAGCSRTFPLDCDSVDTGRASIGLAPKLGVPGYLARVRIFRGVALSDGEPLASAALDTVVSLPTITEDGIVSVTVDLPTASVGSPVATLAAPVAATLETPTAGRVGTWMPSHRVPCNAAAQPGEACVPGGAFWMGNPEVVGIRSSVDANVPRLVVLSPFFIDTTEVTVGPFRAAHVAVVPNNNFLNGNPFDNGGSVGTCTFSSTPVGQDGLPVNCITWQTARAFCTKVGKDLPTEAQYEYVASGLAGLTYVWGEDTPACGDAVFAASDSPNEPQMCKPPPPAQPLLSPLMPGTAALDRILLPGAAEPVVDLAGNLREWALDPFAPETDPCWSAPLLTDPVCNATTIKRAVRGGGYRDQAGFLRAATRHFGDQDGQDDGSGALTAYIDDYGSQPDGELLGFRCARASSP